MRKLLTICCTVVAVLLLDSPETTTESSNKLNANLETLKRTDACRDCYLQGANLYEANFQRADFRGTNLRSAELDSDALGLAKLDGDDLAMAKASGAIGLDPFRPSVTSKPPPQSKSGSGFFVSKKGHVVTNAHGVTGCDSVTVGENTNNQRPADVILMDKRNDLALLKLSSLGMTSTEEKALIRTLAINIVPLAANGLFRSEDVELGEKVMVAGYPYGDIFSNTIKVTFGNVSANRGMGDDSSQFQIDAAVQSGNSGGPIYDESGNIVGVVVAQLNKLKIAKALGSLPENVNFGIKASTVKQFLISSGLPPKWSEKTKVMSTKQLAKIAQKLTLMVICYQ